MRISNCFTKGSSAGGVAGDDSMSDPGERLCFQPTTLFSFFGILLPHPRGQCRQTLGERPRIPISSEIG
jgi:hypothetical protein